MEKFITSHGIRVKKAKEHLKTLPERVSIFDREAFVEFYLLEDIVRLYDYRLATEKKKEVETRAGVKAKSLNLEKFSAVINIFKSAIEVAWGEITSGNYKAVWSAIKERPLMIAAGSLKNLPELRDLAVQLLRQLSDEALKATEQNIILDEDIDDLDAHEENVRRAKDLPSPEQIAAVIKAVEDAIPDRKGKANPNIK
jgi:hypothetical protein